MSPLRALSPENPIVRLVAIVIVACAIGAATSGIIAGALIQSSIKAASRRQIQQIALAQRVQQHLLFQAQVNGCKRMNIRLVAINRNALAQYRFNNLFAFALTKPQPHRTAAQQRLVAVFRARLRDTIATLTWTPLNPACATKPSAVQLPVSFSRRLPTNADLRTG